MFFCLLLVNNFNYFTQRLFYLKYTDLNRYFYSGFCDFAAGLSVGFCGLAAGFAIGVVGDAGVRGLYKLYLFFQSLVD